MKHLQGWEIFTASGARCLGIPRAFFCSCVSSRLVLSRLVTTFYFWRLQRRLQHCLSAQYDSFIFLAVCGLYVCITACTACMCCMRCVHVLHALHAFSHQKSLVNICSLYQHIVELEQKFKKFLKVCIKEELFIVY